MAPRPTCGVALATRGRERLGGAGGALAYRPARFIVPPAPEQ